ncbi:hypothetical protein FA15DRAFT_660666 [Coprinopsis marcescibilis]|uniref:Uncharacterized protein n=1 Tax=Coprinopsis marcescibilis TaxID=230819 RepID=A0A5C3KEV6_COPMA|nr:hypothetical protein FA15DRAFT_660666 [Coprinopsis marcescibilis]
MSSLLSLRTCPPPTVLAVCHQTRGAAQKAALARMSVQTIGSARKNKEHWKAKVAMEMKYTSRDLPERVDFLSAAFYLLWYWVKAWLCSVYAQMLSDCLWTSRNNPINLLLKSNVKFDLPQFNRKTITPENIGKIASFSLADGTPGQVFGVPKSMWLEVFQGAPNLLFASSSTAMHTVKEEPLQSEVAVVVPETPWQQCLLVGHWPKLSVAHVTHPGNGEKHPVYLPVFPHMDTAQKIQELANSLYCMHEDQMMHITVLTNKMNALSKEVQQLTESNCCLKISLSDILASSNDKSWAGKLVKNLPVAMWFLVTWEGTYQQALMYQSIKE